MSPMLAGVLELGMVTGALAFGSGASVVAVRTRALARSDRAALKSARAREAAFADAATRLAVAARASAGAVHEEIARAARVSTRMVSSMRLTSGCAMIGLAPDAVPARPCLRSRA